MQLHLLQLILCDWISGQKKVPVARQTRRLESPNSVTDCRIPTTEHHDSSMIPRFEEGSVDFGSAGVVPVRLVVMIDDCLILIEYSTYSTSTTPRTLCTDEG